MTTKIPLWANKLAVFDTETTGIEVATARVVTATIALLDSGVVTSRRDWVLDPGVPIPPQATAVHGITDEIVKASGIKPQIAITQMLAMLQEALDMGYSLVAYNAAYDLTILKNEATRYGLPWLQNTAPVLDPYVLDRYLDRYRRGKRTLSMVAEHYEVPLLDAHDAAADALATGQVALKIAQKFAAQLPTEAMQVHEMQITWAKELGQSLQEYFDRIGKETTVNTSWPLQ